LHTKVTGFDDSTTKALAAANYAVSDLATGQKVLGLNKRTIAQVQGLINTATGGAGILTSRIGSRPVGIADVQAFDVRGDMTRAAGPDLEVYYAGAIDASKDRRLVAAMGDDDSKFTANALASAINNNSSSQFWAMVGKSSTPGQSGDMVYIFTTEGGNFNTLLACDVAGSDTASRTGLSAVAFENLETGKFNQSGTSFSLGGEHWGTMKPTQSRETLGNQVWNVTLNGRDVGAERDLWIAAAGELATPGMDDGIINGMDRFSFVEIQNAANGDWAGAEVRTQSAAQEALDAITASIGTKDKIRADLGALQNRLENTMTNLTIQAENLQASESRISDVDVAAEMTEFTKNNVLAQAATSMLAQANSLSQLALSLIR
jgi:flagellin-like hook-associated protein FlgL